MTQEVTKLEGALLQKGGNTDQAIKKFETILWRYEHQLAQLLVSKGIDAKTFIGEVVTGIKNDPKLLECELRSLFGAFMVSATLGLTPNTPFGLSWIIGYNTKVDDTWVKMAQFQIGYQGWLELFGRHPEIEQIDCQLVFDNDEFSETKGANPNLIHIPAEDHSKDKRRGAYAIAWLKDKRYPTWVYMSAEEIAHITKKSNGGKGDGKAWKEENDPMGWMWMKSAIKQLAKKLPKTKESKLGVYAQDKEEVGKTITADLDGEKITLNIDPVETAEEKKVRELKEKDDGVADGAGEIFSDVPDTAEGSKAQ
jgi:recombination protein RecT